MFRLPKFLHGPRSVVGWHVKSTNSWMKMPMWGHWKAWVFMCPNSRSCVDPPDIGRKHVYGSSVAWGDDGEWHQGGALGIGDLPGDVCWCKGLFGFGSSSGLGGQLSWPFRQWAGEGFKERWITWNVSSSTTQRLNRLQFQPGAFACVMVYHWHGHWAMARNGQRKRRRDLNSFRSACSLHTNILMFHHLCSYFSPSYFPICLLKYYLVESHGLAWPRKIDWLPWEPFEYWHSDGERLLDPIAGWTHTSQPSHGSVSWLRTRWARCVTLCIFKKQSLLLRSCDICVYLHDSVIQWSSWGWHDFR